MKTLFIGILLLLSINAIAAEIDFTTDTNYTLCPDGTYVSGPTCTLMPDGTFR